MSKQDKIEELKERMLAEDSWLWPLGVPGDSMYSLLVMEAAQELGANVGILEEDCSWDEGEYLRGFVFEPKDYRLSHKNPARPSLVVRETERFEKIYTEIHHVILNQFDCDVGIYPLPLGKPKGYTVTIKDARTHAEDEALLARAKALLAMEDKSVEAKLTKGTCMLMGPIIRNLRAFLTTAERGEKGGAE